MTAQNAMNRTDRSDPEGHLRQAVLDCLDDMKAHEILLLDVRGKTTIADFFVIATATSSRHAQAVSDRIIEKARDLGARPLGIEGRDSADWILIDLDWLVVHVLQAQTRAFYDLEGLWRLSVAD